MHFITEIKAEGRLMAACTDEMLQPVDKLTVSGAGGQLIIVYW